jgi:geranylgeranyl diphosphate synthase type I
MVLDTGYGQWADTLNDSSSLLRLTSKQILEIARTKTALYTLAGPMRIGARLAGASPGAIAALTRYGTALGTAFQIRDDLIDICDGRSLGKDFADDLRRGRISVPIAVALERASGSDRDRLRALCSGDEGVSVSARRSWVLQLLDRTDALAATQRMMNDEVDAAVSALAGLDTPQALLWKKLALSISEEAGRALDRSTLAPVLAQAVSA